MSEIFENRDLNELIASLEAILFASGSPVPVSLLAEALKKSNAEIESALDIFGQDLQNGRGIRLQKFAGKVQLTSSPQFSQEIETFLGIEATSRLSRAALESLAIIAYKQPITRPGIDAIRGVNSDGVLRSLLNKGLVEEIGRAEGPGRPILYGVTSEFLQNFGLNSIQELPELSLDETDNKLNAGLLKD